MCCDCFLFISYTNHIRKTQFLLYIRIWQSRLIIPIECTNRIFFIYFIKQTDYITISNIKSSRINSESTKPADKQGNGTRLSILWGLFEAIGRLNTIFSLFECYLCVCTHYGDVEEPNGDIVPFQPSFPPNAIFLWIPLVSPSTCHIPRTQTSDWIFAICEEYIYYILKKKNIKRSVHVCFLLCSSNDLFGNWKKDAKKVASERVSPLRYVCCVFAKMVFGGRVAHKRLFLRKDYFLYESNKQKQKEPHKKLCVAVIYDVYILSWKKKAAWNVLRGA